MIEQKVKWSELFIKEFKERLSTKPVVYLPMGLCEPHGHIAALGLDTIKAEWLCEQAARKYGGIVAPTQGYQIHEVGFHAPWLAEVAGNTNVFLTSMPTAPMLYSFLYQLRAFHNAGFQLALIISGHAGGNQEDFRLAANVFMKESDMIVKVYTDPELTNGKYAGDHAGKYEISQLMYIHPSLVDLNRINEWQKENVQTRYAQGEDAAEASIDFGKEIMERCLDGINHVLQSHQLALPKERNLMPYTVVEKIWQEVKSQQSIWLTANIKPEQTATPNNSIWKTYEQYEIK